MILQNLYQTKIECLKDSDDSNYYNVNIDSTDVRVVVSLIDFNGNPVTNKNITLTVDKGTFTSVKSGYTGTIASDNQSVTGTTDSSGQFAVLYSATVWGLATFSANNSNIQIDVTGWRNIYNANGFTVDVNQKEKLTHISFSKSLSVAKDTWTQILAEGQLPAYCCPLRDILFISPTGRTIFIKIWRTGKVEWTSSSALTNHVLSFISTYKYKE